MILMLHLKSIIVQWNTQIRATSDFSSSINLFNLNDHPSYLFFSNSKVILNGIECCDSTNNYNMKFKNYDNAGNSASSVMTLNYNNGNVGIGTEDPLSKLHVEGSVNIGNTSSASILSVSSLDKATLSLESAEEFDSTTNPGYNKTISQIHFKSLDTSINNLQYTQSDSSILAYVQVYKQSLRVRMVHLLE